MSVRRLVLSGGLLLASALFMGCQARNTPPVAPAAQPKLTAAAVAEATDHCDPQAVAAVKEAASATIEISPGASTITADDAGLQLLASRKTASSVRDVTVQAKWTVEPAASAEIEPGGYLHPKTEGAITVKAAFEGHEATAKYTLEPRSSRTWDFAEDIVPILTRLGCNTGSCHGKADGQNGFHLSLFGYDRAGDYQALARDDGQRRLSRIVPERACSSPRRPAVRRTAAGRRLEVGSPEYQTLLAGSATARPNAAARCTARCAAHRRAGHADPGEPGPRSSASSLATPTVTSATSPGWPRSASTTTRPRR